MKILRSGPPTTHDSVLWRVPLNGRPLSAWQKAFEAVDASGGVRNPRRVHFESEALTFRCDEGEVAAWVQAIDQWIASANETLSTLEEKARAAADSAAARTNERRQRATDANDRFKDL